MSSKCRECVASSWLNSSILCWGVVDAVLKYTGATLLCQNQAILHTVRNRVTHQARGPFNDTMNNVRFILYCLDRNNYKY